MNNDLLLGARTLAKGAIDRLDHARGRRIECLSGALWVTQDNDLRDIVLQGGAGFTVDVDGDVLVSSLADARYLLLCNTGDVTASAP